ncbi:MAG: AcrB/AcrD/AcrF family protein [Gammaproteobacteria bacterium]|nr:MAG: AcrB/AcrD/AcrF family protein [Gammaproteobacteria bacterium]
MLTLAAVVLGLFSLGSLKIDLLPHIIYPSIAVRINDPGVPARIMEDEVTRQLEEQLAITEGAIHVRSATREGRSAVDLDFAYGHDIDAALRDASTRLDRARRFLPETIEPPVIYKRDPSQLPAAEYAISSSRLDPVELREWVDYTLGKWLVTIPGVAAAEVAGGLRREIQVLADQDDLAARKLDILDIEKLLESENRNIAGGRLRLPEMEIPVQTRGRFRHLETLEQLPLELEEHNGDTATLPLETLARIYDSHEEPRLRIRLNELPAIKLSIQKQPQANTVSVVDNVNRQLAELRSRGMIPKAVEVTAVNDEARHIRRALRNATGAALSGAALAMLVVWLFLGSVRRTLVIGSAIPIAILVTVTLMAAGHLTLNIMTLGGLALGIGMLVDSTIVMLENIYRHQRLGEEPLQASERAASEVTSAIVASTSTNLAAVLPFLFIGGLIGLLFNELIITISAAIVAAMVVALTLVPALAGRIPAGNEGRFRRFVNRAMTALQNGYAWLLARLLKVSWLVILAFVLLFALTVPDLLKPLASFLPRIDDGRIGIYLTADRGVSVDEMDRITRRVEQKVLAQPEVSSVFTTVGGFTFGRSRYETANRANLQVQLVPAGERPPAGEWIGRMQKLLKQEQLAGVKIRIRQRGIRGLRVGRGNDDISFQVQGPDLDRLEEIGRRMAETLKQVPGLRNVKRSNEDLAMQLSIDIDREKARQLGLDTERIGKAVRYALEGKRVSRFIAGDRSIDILLRLEAGSRFPPRLEELILMGGPEDRTPVRLGQVAKIELALAPATIIREQQQRVVEVTATLEEGANLSRVIAQAHEKLAGLELPEGYVLYEGGSLKTLQQGQETGYRLLALALFLVLVVMAVQYESLRNPLVILFSVFFSLIGVALGLEWTDTPLSMPVWLGMIMLAGIVVNNAIILIEYIELKRMEGLERSGAITEAARLRLRPILMTTLTTVVGMLPLALAIGEGSEMLQPLAITLVSGLTFSLLVTLLLVPSAYTLMAKPKRQGD